MILHLNSLLYLIYLIIVMYNKSIYCIFLKHKITEVYICYGRNNLYFHYFSSNLDDTFSTDFIPLSPETLVVDDISDKEINRLVIFFSCLVFCKLHEKTIFNYFLIL